MERSTREMRVDQSQSSEGGFVLPYVLVVIAIIAIAASFAAQRLQNISGVMSGIQDRARIETALMSAESDAIFALMTGFPMQGGVDLNASQLSEIEQMEWMSENRELPEVNIDFWSAAGGVRYTPTLAGDIKIAYRDGAGYFPLNTASPQEVKTFLTGFGISSEQASGLAAKLADYRDGDNTRRFEGAERADYRLRGLPSPANASIRHVSELDRILGWRAALTDVDSASLKRAVTLSPSAVGMKLAYTPLALQDKMGLNANSTPDSQQIDADLFADDFPGAIFRLTLSVPKDGAQSVIREIEVERRASNLEKPFRKFVVYEMSVLETDSPQGLTLDRDKKYVIQTPSHRAP